MMNRRSFPTSIVPEPSPDATVSKVLNACDECRARKLKCSGEQRGCARCIADRITCKYSPRKQLGRPRKRKREDVSLMTDRSSSHGSPGIVEGQKDINGITYMVSLANEAMPMKDSNTSWLDPELYDQGRTHEPDSSFNFDFSQEIGRNTFQGVPDLPTQTLLPNSDSCMYTAPLQMLPSPLTDDHSRSTLSEASALGCNCLSQLYAMLSAFRLSPPPAFPYSMAALKAGARLATEVVRCQDCAEEYNSSLQNGMMLGTLLHLLINEYRKLLDHIDERSTSNDTIPFRMGELSPGTEHLHTGTPDCPMAINIDLSGPEWRSLARKTVAKEVLGRPGDQSLAQILQEMKDRQVKWHLKYTAELHKHGPGGGEVDEEREQGDNGMDGACLQVVFVDRLRVALDALSL